MIGAPVRVDQTPTPIRTAAQPPPIATALRDRRPPSAFVVAMSACHVKRSQPKQPQCRAPDAAARAGGPKRLSFARPAQRTCRGLLHFGRVHPRRRQTGDRRIRPSSSARGLMSCRFAARSDPAANRDARSPRQTALQAMAQVHASGRGESERGPQLGGRWCSSRVHHTRAF